MATALKSKPIRSKLRRVAKPGNQKKTAKEVKNYKFQYFSASLDIFLGALGDLGGSKKDLAIVLSPS